MLWALVQKLYNLSSALPLVELTGVLACRNEEVAGERCVNSARKTWRECLNDGMKTAQFAACPGISRKASFRANVQL